jgi:CRISPR-associated endonuclease/helicase Cas3
MTFFSHSITLNDGTKTGVKTIQKHTQNVTRNALCAFEQTVSFSIGSRELKTIIEDICRYHDLGKYTSYFQTYLLTNKTIDTYLKAHARFGAYSIFQKYHKRELSIALFLYFIVVNHHRNLDYIRDNEFSKKEEAKLNEGNFTKQKLTLNEFLQSIKQELHDENLEEYLKVPNEKLFYKITKKIFHEPNIQNYFLINYLFSLLIEADKLDASDTLLYFRSTIPTHLVNDYRPLNISTIAEIKDIKEVSQNELRSYCRLRVNQLLDRKDWYEHKLFTLTAPTGVGKTLTALDFSLKLRAKIRETEQREAQIIYALPFINITEQSYQVYTEVFTNQNISLLAHYQYADALEQTSRDETNNYGQKMMTLDTWQCDVVITTFVQFLQTLIGNRNKLLKKFNHFAGSIIILDEIQTIRLGQLPLIGASLYYLSKFLNARIILMTATKPKIYELANQEILTNEGEKAESFELLPDYEEVFKCFKRTKIVSLIDQKLENENVFVDNMFLEKWDERQSCIIVCNTVKRSLDLFNLLNEKVEKSKNPIYYLSTNIIPARRQRIIESIKRNIAEGLKPILVATQCVEAGVDLDFDMGFRDLGPIDSIIQVAGRINRNNNSEKEYSPLYIIDFGDCIKIYDAITQQQARKVLNENPEVKEERYLNLIEGYFAQISENKSFLDSRKIFYAMKTLKYDSDDPKKDIAVSSFQVIDEKSPTLSIFIEIDENATQCKNLFIQMIHNEISSEKFSPFKKDFHQHIIAIPGNLPKAEELKRDKQYLLCEGIYIVTRNELASFYDLTTGFNRSKENKEHSMFL